MPCHAGAVAAAIYAAFMPLRFRRRHDADALRCAIDYAAILPPLPSYIRRYDCHAMRWRYYALMC